MKLVPSGDLHLGPAADDGLTASDALLIRRHVVQLPVNLPQGCPPLAT